MRRDPIPPNLSLLRAFLAAGVIVALLIVAPAAQASKAVVNTFGAPVGEGNGQLNSPAGIAVNSTGAGGVSPGEVYVVDSANSRIQEFSAAGVFVRAFGYDIVASGPDNTGANEKQTLTVNATGGTFALRVTKRIVATFNANSNVVTDLNVPTSAFHVGDAVKGPFPEGTTITAIGIESLVLSAVANTTSPGEFRGIETTGPIPYNSTAAELEAALEALPAIGSGNVEVSEPGGSGAPLEIEYKGVLAHDDVAHTNTAVGDRVSSIATVSTELSGATHTATLATTVPGGGYEVCDAFKSTDVCKAGPHCNRGESAPEVCQESSAAGSLDEPSGIAIDQKNGNVYVTDVADNSGISNNRVDVYSATGAFEGAFGWDVNAGSPKEELQFCTMATGCQHGTVGSGAGQLNPLRESLPALGPNGHLYVPDGGSNGTAEDSNKRVDEFAPVLNGSDEVTGVSFAGALGWDVVASGPDQATEVQKVVVRAGAGKFELSFKSSVTGELASNAPAAEDEEVAGGPESVEKALDVLPTISSGGGSVKVTGGPGSVSGETPYAVTFDGGPLARTDVAEMVATKLGLSGGSPSTVLRVETYSNGTEGLEYCVISRGDVCKPGSDGPDSGDGKPNLRLGEFSDLNPFSVALDQSGALYIVNESSNFSNFGPARIYKFTFPAPGEVTAAEFAPEFLTEASGDPSAVDPTNVAVDPENQHVLVAKKEGLQSTKFYEFDSSGVFLDSYPKTEAGLKTESDFGLATGIGGRFYFSNGLGMVDVFGNPPPPAVSIAAVTGIGARTATFHGTVTPPAPVEGTGFDTTYHFEYSPDGVNWSRFPAEDVDVGDGTGSGPATDCPTNNPPTCTVEQTVNDLVPNSHYQVRLVASTGTVSVSASKGFTTEAGAPLLSGSNAEEVGQISARLSGLINPGNEDTTYHFEWGTDTSYGDRIPVGTDGSAGSGGTPVKVSGTLEGLNEGAIYHFRLVATNPSGTTVGPDGEFSTLDRYRLPDARVPEQVTPNDKRPAGFVAQLLEGNLVFQASRDGNSIIYPLLNGTADATAGGNVDYLGARGESGWLASQLTPSSLVPAVKNQVGEDATGYVVYASADLSCEIIESFEPLTDTPAIDVTDGVKNLYRRSADGKYTLLTAPVPLTPQDSVVFTVNWASTDCSHVLFEARGHRLLEEAPGESALYEWADGTLRVVGVRPDESAPSGESVASDAKAGTDAVGKQVQWNSMSADGSRVFFTAVSEAGADKGKKAIFLRQNGASTVDISQSHTAAVDLGAYYATATPDGSRVLFLANYGLASNGTSTGPNDCTAINSTTPSGAGCDLYDYDISTKALTDLSADSNAADTGGAGVVGVFDASEDGSYIYFAARGQLVAGEGKTEAQNLDGNGTYNVYVSHEGSLAYVGLITDADATFRQQGGIDVSFEFTHWAAEATPDGKHLLFVSKANVTNYDSKGVTEAYVYSVASGKTVCVSCRADGMPSIGDGHTEPITVDPFDERLNTTQSRPRAISDDGRRVFFTMPDVLATGARSGGHNIYEWEAGRVYLLVAGEAAEPDPTRYADASASGNDVFIVTKAKLVSRDFDGTTDVYDLRVGGGLVEPEAAAPPCEPLQDTCQGEGSPQPRDLTSPLSEAFSGPGNPLAVVVPCKKGLVLAHGKCVRKKPVVKSKKAAPKRCRRGFVSKRGRCVRKRSASSRAKRAAINHGRTGR